MSHVFVRCFFSLNKMNMNKLRLRFGTVKVDICFLLKFGFGLNKTKHLNSTFVSASQLSFVSMNQLTQLLFSCISLH